MKHLELGKYNNDKNMQQLANYLINIDCPIYISGHINADYDSLCSSLTLAVALSKIGKKVKVLFDEDAQILYSRADINGFDDLICTQLDNNNKDYACVLCDMNVSRRSNFESVFLNAKYKVNIDHHDNNKMLTEIKYVDANAGANCENILKLILQLEKMQKVSILNKSVCCLLSMGIITDTSNIVKSSNLEQTNWAINIIKSFDVDINKIADLVYLNLNEEQQLIYKLTLKNKHTFDNISYYYIDEKQLKDIKVIHNDYSMVLSKILEQDTNPIVLYEQRGDDSSIWEFRSSNPNELPVNEIALFLGGGGHKNASGATIKDKTSMQVVESFINYFKDEAIDIA